MHIERNPWKDLNDPPLLIQTLPLNVRNKEKSKELNLPENKNYKIDSKEQDLLSNEEALGTSDGRA